MFAEIEKKKKLLRIKRPFPDELRVTAEKLDLFDFLYTDLKLDGSSLTHEGVSRIIDGGLIPGVSIAEHHEAERHGDLLREFASMIDMELSIDARQLARLYSVLTGKPAEYRKSNPVLFHLDYTPQHYSDVEKNLSELFREVYGGKYDDNYLLGAAALHDGLVRVYPYEENSEMLARVALQYELQRNGLPIVQIGLSEQEYNRRLSAAIKTGDHSGLYEAVLQGLDHKLDLLLNTLL